MYTNLCYPRLSYDPQFKFSFNVAKHKHDLEAAGGESTFNLDQPDAKLMDLATKHADKELQVLLGGWSPKEQLNDDAKVCFFIFYVFG